MTMPVLAMLLIGAALGRRFKVLILIPVVGLAFITILAAGIARGDSVAAMLIATVLASICLQTGYLCGVLTLFSSFPLPRTVTSHKLEL